VAALIARPDCSNPYVEYNPSMIDVDPVFSRCLRLGILVMEGVRVQPSPEALKSMINSLAGDTAARYAGQSLGEIPVVQQIRRIFHQSGVDPTRYRPSSESLLRRAVSGKGLYLINSVVDLVNYFSLKLLYPMGLYDHDRLKPPIALRVGKPGETYEGIGRQSLNLAGFPLLVDQEGPFGSPISDSMRTRVTEECSRLLWVTFGPPASVIPHDAFAAAMVQFNGGSVTTSTEI
jgi:DNA/RNA-binding domain of Phe-tRNA-synthetase-like protein